ncbi:MAG: hypothetical protein K6G23_08020 [Lachnospiraceae bacterium]|nr:hypothetical protein [Lachnospiraceae bacterium]
MTADEMNRKYAPLVKKYAEMFGYTPKANDYICLSLDQFYAGLIKAIKARKELKYFLISKNRTA